MITYPLPRFEQQRAEVQQRYGILQGSTAFDTSHVARTVGLVLGVQMVVAGLNERYRSWYRCSHGIAPRAEDAIQDFCALAQLSDRSFVVDNVREDPYFASHPAVTGYSQIRFFAGAPLRNPEGRRFGTLCVMDRVARQLNREQMAVLESFAELLSQEICVRSAARYALHDLVEVERDKCSLYDMAMTDPMTGALNRRAFSHFTEREMKRALRHDTPLSVVLFDIDHFKKVNDTHGHSAGDEVISTLARTVANAVRDEDYLGRLGGEEFGIVLPQTPIEGAIELANRLRQAISGLTFFGDGHAFSVTSSFGVTLAVPYDRDIGQALDRADRALYAAKRNGRNRVESLRSEPPLREVQLTA
jgi:diguanylate cyclase (GGDEF)-like protein